MRIGVFDSGLGGLSVVRAIRQQLPRADLLYFADQAMLPYGQRPPEQVRSLTGSACDWLMAQGCSAIVLACNTATAAAVAERRARHPGFGFVGMEPAIKPAAEATRSGVVGVLATPGTLSGQHFQQTRAAHAAHLKVIERGCPGWVEAVESGLSGDALRELLRVEVEPLIDAGADWLVLGCTHFPFLAATIAEVAGPGVSLLDPAPSVARQLARVAGPGADQGSGELQAVSTAEPARLADGIRRLLGEQVRVAGLRREGDQLAES